MYKELYETLIKSLEDRIKKIEKSVEDKIKVLPSDKKKDKK